MNEISANNLKMTDSMRAYVEEKIGSTVARYDMVTRCDTHLSVLRNPAVSDTDSCEVVVFAEGTVVRAAERSSSMYAAIDLVAAKISRKLRKVKERREDRSQKKDPLREAVYETEPSDEPVAPPQEIIRTKAFPMPAQTLEDAKFCLDALDHDFYMFLSAETGKMSVLYKRHEGGLGLIQPEGQ
ncbi:ribosomal subunit interface protein [Pelagophyceae sp. CCMP2097]|nr:ribosomal subunit interface protein [Pelagophyceae sp. CCMP2097]